MEFAIGTRAASRLPGGCLTEQFQFFAPQISVVDSLTGFHIATDFSGHRCGIGPGAGRLPADLVSGSDPIVDPKPFRYSRMIDGTKLAPNAGL
jgi:glycine/D-amino acid oxidase-like deaminating enzyme